MIRKIAVAAGACAVISLAAAAQAVDGASVELGRGDDRTNLLRFAVQWNWRSAWPAGRQWRLGGYWELSAGAWGNHDKSSADFALTPVFRLERHADAHSPYLEAAIGFHILSRHISRERLFSTNFQFGDHLGAGVRFGAGGRYDLGLRLQHISNGGIREPNPGIDFLMLRLQHHFE